MWEDTPELVSDTFPGNATYPGMKRLSEAVGGLPFKAHLGSWSLGKNGDKPNPYFSNADYKFVTGGNTGLPQGPALWDHGADVRAPFTASVPHHTPLYCVPPPPGCASVVPSFCACSPPPPPPPPASAARRSPPAAASPNLPAFVLLVFSTNRDNFNLRAIKQDHMNEQLGLSQCTTTTNVARDWLAGMGESAKRQNFTIQYCMSLPSVTMNSATIIPSTHQRLGGDYLSGDNEKNWRIGSASIFVHAVGLLPFKDAFLSNSTQAPPTHSSEQRAGGFMGFVEKAPELHAASALLSAGPVSPSDGVDGHDQGLLLSLCRADGVLLKPDKPARTIDLVWLGKLNAALDKSSGVVWTTFTEYNGASWGYIFVQGAEASWKADATDLGFGRGTVSAGVAWTRPKDQAHTFVKSMTVTTKFGPGEPLAMPTTGMEYNAASWALVYTSPVLSNSFVVLGEVDKMVPISKQRIASMAVSSTSSVTLNCAAWNPSRKGLHPLPSSRRDGLSCVQYCDVGQRHRHCGAVKTVNGAARRKIRRTSVIITVVFYLAQLFSSFHHTFSRTQKWTLVLDARRPRA